jgi:tetratricopeptide (TPR) repeat protein
MKKLFIILLLALSVNVNAQKDSVDLAIENLKQIVANHDFAQGMYPMYLTVYNFGLVIKTGDDNYNFLFSSPWDYKKKSGDYPRLYIKDEVKGVSHGYVVKIGLKKDQATDGSRKKAKKENSLEDFISNLGIVTRYHMRLLENPEDSLAVFESSAKASPYDTSAVQISENQHKLMVQGNLLFKNQEYLAALDKYHEIIKADPLKCPYCYSSIAFIYAALRNYKLAIFNMKKYLFLYPDAPDARAAQDKIFEWELLLS